jgi:hypothetical protein
MGTFLLQHPWVQAYLVFVTVIWTAFFWVWWLDPPVPRVTSRTPRPQPVRVEPRSGSVSSSTQRPD